MTTITETSCLVEVLRNNAPHWDADTHDARRRSAAATLQGLSNDSLRMGCISRAILRRSQELLYRYDQLRDIGPVYNMDLETLAEYLVCKLATDIGGQLTWMQPNEMAVKLSRTIQAWTYELHTLDLLVRATCLDVGIDPVAP